MWPFIISILFNLEKVYALWDADVNCPTSCSCSLLHLTETSVYGFKNRFREQQTLIESDFHLNNEVIYDDPFEADLDNYLLKSVTCLLQTETEPIELLENLPRDIESLRFIQGFESGNKTIAASELLKFEDLRILELQGTLFLGNNNDSFIVLFDAPLLSVEYINLENVHIKKANKTSQFIEPKIKEDEMTFEYTQQFRSNLHPLTIIQKGPKEEKIIPYNKYKEQETDLPHFAGFTNLQLLRVSNCRLNTLKWEMFDGLQKLEHLILEKNNIMFLPDFVFFGTPNLKSLSLAWNNLLSIQVTDLAGLLELEYLDVSHNKFSQLSELSLPPFPKLKLANFKNNPITIVFPSTFEVLNTTDSLIIGSTDTAMTLIANSFLGLKLLGKLTLENVSIPLLKRELLFGMPNLKELDISGNISEIEFDAFMETNNLHRLILSRCNIRNVSMDAFMGLIKLRILDLSRNKLEYLPPNVFDPLTDLKELYLNENSFSILPSGIFTKIHPKLIRLNQNPWHCSCHMSDWKPMVINKVKQKHLKICDFSHDKSVSCEYENRHITKYIFDTRVAPKCALPEKFKDWNVFHVMRKQLGCSEFKPKLKKRIHTDTALNKNSNLELLYLKKKIPENLHSSVNENSTNISSTSVVKNVRDDKAIDSTITSNSDLDFQTNNAIPLQYQNNPIKFPLLPPVETLINENNEANELNPLNNSKSYARLLNKNGISNAAVLKSIQRGNNVRKIKKNRKKYYKSI